MSPNINASGFGLTICGRCRFRGVRAGDGEGVRDVLGVEAVLYDLMDRDEGVRGKAENRFKFVRVALKGLLLLLPLDGVRRSSIPRPFVLGGGSGGDLTDGDLDILQLSSSCCAFPFGEDDKLDSLRLTQLFSLCISIPPLRSDDPSSLSSCMGNSFFFGEADNVRFSFVSLEST